MNVCLFVSGSKKHSGFKREAKGGREHTETEGERDRQCEVSFIILIQSQQNF